MLSYQVSRMAMLHPVINPLRSAFTFPWDLSLTSCTSPLQLAAPERPQSPAYSIICTTVYTNESSTVHHHGDPSNRHGQMSSASCPPFPNMSSICTPHARYFEAGDTSVWGSCMSGVNCPSLECIARNSDVEECYIEILLPLMPLSRLGELQSPVQVSTQ